MFGMFDVFSSKVRVSVRQSLSSTAIDNNVWFLYYRVTAWAMVIASVAVSAKQVLKRFVNVGTSINKIFTDFS